jgi:hypothetical protein
MKKYPMPVGSARRTRRLDFDDIGFFQCKVQVPSMYIPPLPLAQKHKLLFPVGTFSGIYSTKELELADSLGCKIEIEYGYVFPDAYLFDEYINRFFALKEKGDGATREIAKLLLNSLYGKFGQNRRKTVIIKPEEDKHKGLIPYNDEYGLYQKESVSRATFIIPSIAAWITSCARVELMNWLMRSGQEHVFYCDTDSVVSTKELPTGSRLGELKLEYDADEGIFLLPKMYAIRQQDKTIIKAKGFERDFANKLPFSAFEAALHGDKTAFQQEVTRFGKLKEVLRREGKFVSMLTKKKSIQSEYSKRNVVSNYDTEPVRVSL